MTLYQPILYRGVMISGTYADLEDHRAALIKALDKQGFKSVAMEQSSPRSAPGHDLIESSLHMVRDATAYVLIIGKRYGQTPLCPIRNPRQLSITELEFQEAQRLRRPTLLFLMSDEHLIREADIEPDPGKKDKLLAFRERAQQIGPEHRVSRVFVSFKSLQDFTEQAIHATATLRRDLEGRADEAACATSARAAQATPPAFRAEPPYIGSHRFVGRSPQLEQLDDWSSASDPNTILLFDAIGGAGKSILTWEWVTQHASSARNDWAGRCWYSFYERGAVLADFCRHALSYMTGTSTETLRNKEIAELSEILLAELRERPWLLVLDGIERTLAAYNDYDPTRIADHDVGSDVKPAEIDPCSCILREDTELLRAFSGARPSKLLITTRLVPRALLNASGQPLPGVQRVSLPGLRPADAEALFRSCGIRGTSHLIQHFLRNHFDCHPLIIGVLAGLVNDHLPDRGNFDAWMQAEEGRLNLAALDLTQKRNHILSAAINALSNESSRLLSMLSMLSGSVDYDTLCAINPHVAPLPAVVSMPTDPRTTRQWMMFTPTHKQRVLSDYEQTLERRRTYDAAVLARNDTLEIRSGQPGLRQTVRDLESRGLLQFDLRLQRYDLHPVVRGVAAGRLSPRETEEYGATLIDHFSHRTRVPAAQVASLEDVLDVLQVLRTSLRMGRMPHAAHILVREIATPLYENLEAHALLLSLVRPFFPNGWQVLPSSVSVSFGAELARIAGQVLMELDTLENTCLAHSAAIHGLVRESQIRSALCTLSNVSYALRACFQSARAAKICSLVLELASLLDDDSNGSSLIVARLGQFSQLTATGCWAEAEALWSQIKADPHELRDFEFCNPGELEFRYAFFRFAQGTLSEAHLAAAESAARSVRTKRWNSRELYAIRGIWHLDRGENELAAQSLAHAQRMAREVNDRSPAVDTYLLLAQHRLGKIADLRQAIRPLAQARYIELNALAEVFLEIGDRESAERFARRALEVATADGAPFVYYRKAEQAKHILNRLGLAIPPTRTYETGAQQRYLWEEVLDQCAASLKAAVLKAVGCRTSSRRQAF